MRLLLRRTLRVVRDPRLSLPAHEEESHSSTRDFLEHSLSPQPVLIIVTSNPYRCDNI